MSARSGCPHSVCSCAMGATPQCGQAARAEKATADLRVSEQMRDAEHRRYLATAAELAAARTQLQDAAAIKTALEDHIDILPCYAEQPHESHIVWLNILPSSPFCCPGVATETPEPTKEWANRSWQASPTPEPTKEQGDA